MSPETKVLYEFGKFRCDPREHLLLSDGKPVLLSPKAFEILVALIQSNGRLLTKDELMQQVWPDSFVEEANLTVNISALRKALGKLRAGSNISETIPKRGYRFIAPVTEHLDAGKIAPSVQTARIELKLGPVPSPKRSAGSHRWWLAAAGMLLVAILVSAVCFPAANPNSPTKTPLCWPISPIRRETLSLTVRCARVFPRSWNSRHS